MNLFQGMRHTLGKVIEYPPENVGNVPQWFVGSLAKQVERMEFMPGYYDGKPVPMAYIEPWLK